MMAVVPSPLRLSTRFAVVSCPARAWSTSRQDWRHSSMPSTWSSTLSPTARVCRSGFAASTEPARPSLRATFARRRASAGSRLLRFRSRSTIRRSITWRPSIGVSSNGSRPRRTVRTHSRRSSKVWLYRIGDEVMRLRGISEDDPAFAEATEQRLQDKLADLSKRNAAYAAGARCLSSGDA